MYAYTNFPNNLTYYFLSPYIRVIIENITEHMVADTTTNYTTVTVSTRLVSKPVGVFWAFAKTIIRKYPMKIATIFRVPVAVARPFCHRARCFIVYFFMRHNWYARHGRRTPVLLLLLLYTVGDGNLFCLRRLDSAKRVQNCYSPDTAAARYFT